MLKAGCDALEDVRTILQTAGWREDPTTSSTESEISDEVIESIFDRAISEYTESQTQLQEPDGRPLDDGGRSLLRRFVTNGLSPLERLIIIHYYYHELSIAEIASELSVQETVVRQLHSVLLQRAKAELEAYRLGKAAREQYSTFQV